MTGGQDQVRVSNLGRGKGEKRGSVTERKVLGLARKDSSGIVMVCSDEEKKKVHKRDKRARKGILPIF